MLGSVLLFFVQVFLWVNGIIDSTQANDFVVNDVEQVKDGKLQRFAIAGADKKWHWAEATIDGDTVVVKSPKVSKPVAVRYGFTINPETANLYNKEGLPASPFTTVD